MILGIRQSAPVVIVYALLLTVGLLAKGHLTPVIVSGASMRPALLPGDIVVVASRPAPRVGDIALIRSGRSLVLHRVTLVRGDGSVLTRGDANPIGDLNPTPKGRVQGRVAAVVPAGRLLERWRSIVGWDTLPAQTHTALR